MLVGIRVDMHGDLVENDYFIATGLPEKQRICDSVHTVTPMFKTYCTLFFITKTFISDFRAKTSYLC